MTQAEGNVTLLRQDLERLESKERAFSRKCPTSVIGRTIYWLESVLSTNEVAKDLIREAVPEGTVVVADEQTRGRGRRGATWLSPRGEGLWFTVILYPSWDMSDATRMNRLGAEAVAKTLQETYKIKAKVKEPNDVLVEGKKICGVLAEMATAAGSVRPEYLIVGCGLNLTTRFPPELAGYATAVADHVKKCPSPSQVLIEICKHLEASYLI